MSEFTFVHIPRNGGTTIKRAINNLGISRTVVHDRHIWSKLMHVPPLHESFTSVSREGGDDEDIKDMKNISNKQLHMSRVEVPYSPEHIHQVVTHKTRCSDAIGKSKPIVILRDPIDRVISLYKLWKYGVEKGRKRREKRLAENSNSLQKQNQRQYTVLDEDNDATANSRTTESFIDMFASKTVCDENSNNGTFRAEYLLPQSYWVDIDLTSSSQKSSLIVIPYTNKENVDTAENTTEKEEEGKEEEKSDTDIVSSIYNAIKSSNSMKEKHHEYFRQSKAELTSLRLNQCSLESRKENNSEIFSESELTFFKKYYKSDYDMIASLSSC